MKGLARQPAYAHSQDAGTWSPAATDQGHICVTVTPATLGSTVRRSLTSAHGTLVCTADVKVGLGASPALVMRAGKVRRWPLSFPFITRTIPDVTVLVCSQSFMSTYKHDNKQWLQNQSLLQTRFRGEIRFQYLLGFIIIQVVIVSIISLYWKLVCNAFYLYIILKFFS